VRFAARLPEQRDTFDMTRSSLSYLLLAAAMGASSTARADNSDIDVPGPVGRSSVMLYGG
jgi:hypothetical protein